MNTYSGKLLPGLEWSCALDHAIDGGGGASRITSMLHIGTVENPRRAMTTLTLSCRHLPECTLIRVMGEVDRTNSDQLKHAIDEACGPGRPLILDLGYMNFMDSTGLRVILDAHTAAERRGDRVHLAAVLRTPKRILEITGVIRHLHLYASLKEALADAGRHAVPGASTGSEG
ncbi:STAS domain-containing protein [Nonomuraea sp. NPDC050536]|uniref:STAS domain-containing protein n=1 Tax=Nonomuraea sp. NPDC050536 TaxID=3364366 RepID=UPI0037C66D99